MIRKEFYETITAENSALVIIDHQLGLYSGVRDIPIDELKHNITGLVKAIKVFGIPIVVTTTTERIWGPMIPELREILKEIPVIERTTVNAWDDQRVANAIEKTGRKKLIMTGISTDVCLAFPAMPQQEKHDVYESLMYAFTIKQGESLP